MVSSPDRIVLGYAGLMDMVLVTKDRDFDDLALLGGENARVLRLDLGNCTTDEIEVRSSVGGSGAPGDVRGQPSPRHHSPLVTPVPSVAAAGHHRAKGGGTAPAIADLRPGISPAGLFDPHPALSDPHPPCLTPTGSARTLRRPAGWLGVPRVRTAAGTPPAPSGIARGRRVRDPCPRR